jgi:phage repressor protein C with HTH and peptisase S24 domain
MQKNTREISVLKERILQYLDIKGISKYECYQNTGITNGVLSQKSGISEDNILRFLSYYDDISTDWLLMGKGNMLKTYSNSEESVDMISEPVMTVRRLKTDYFDLNKQVIPLYEIDAAAGLNTLFSNQTTQVPLDYIVVPSAPKCDGALFVRGDSMYPILKAGDIVCYKFISDLQNIRYGEIYILDIDDGDDQYLTIKYLQKSDFDNKHIKLVSHNPHHDPKEEKLSNIRSLAIVKLWIRYNTIS